MLTIDTKFIERNQSLLDQWLNIIPGIAIAHGETDFYPKYGFRDDSRHYTLRILDPSLMQQFGIPFREFSLSRSELAKCEFGRGNLIIVENRTNLLTLPEIPETMDLEGHGKAVNRYEDLNWAHPLKAL